MMRFVGEDAAQLVVTEAARAHHYLAEERIGCRVVVEQDERRAARNVKSVAGAIDRMLLSEPENQH